MARFIWSDLNKHQVGRFAEYFVKMEFALYAFEVFTSEVDDRGIDFVARHKNTGFYEVQVKSVRESKYVFMQKRHFPLEPQRLLALVLLAEGKEPDLYLIPATEWLNPNRLLVDRNYEKLKSKPEWGLQISNKSFPMLAKYRFDTSVASLMSPAKK